MKLLTKRVYLMGLMMALSQFGCSGNPSRARATLNRNATLTGDLPENPL
jgi:hypothetical protein